MAQVKTGAIKTTITRGTTTSKDKDLHEMMYHEIESKSKSCSNPTYQCTIPRLPNQRYCIRHILRDPRAGYKQCAHIFQNGKKCINAVPKAEFRKDGHQAALCFEHNRQLQLAKTRNALGRWKRVQTNETLLNALSVHVNVDDVAMQMPYEQGMEEEIDVVTPVMPTFAPHEHVQSLDKVLQGVKKRKRVLDYASDSSNEEEPLCINVANPLLQIDDSDDDSCHSEEEDNYLQHAGIYTRQETLAMSEKKLSQLQGLYIGQINRLHYMLKNKRREYLKELRKEREHHCSVYDQIKNSPQERFAYDKLKALNHHHRRYGNEAVLHKRMKEKQIREHNNKTPGFPKCIYAEGGVKCSERSLPFTKHCRKHILEDKKQILYRACQVEKSGVICQETIPSIGEDATCVLHMTMPVYKQYVQKKYDSETEESDDDVPETSAGALKKAALRKMKTMSSHEGVVEAPKHMTEVLKHDLSLGPEHNLNLGPEQNITISHDANEIIVSTDTLAQTSANQTGVH